MRPDLNSLTPGFGLIRGAEGGTTSIQGARRWESFRGPLRLASAAAVTLPPCPKRTSKALKPCSQHTDAGVQPGASDPEPLPWPCPLPTAQGGAGGQAAEDLAFRVKKPVGGWGKDPRGQHPPLEDMEHHSVWP